MKQTYFLIFIALFLIHKSSRARSTDTLPFLSAKWEKTDLGNGLMGQHYQFKSKELFNDNQNIHILTSIYCRQFGWWRLNNDVLSHTGRSEHALRQ
jgi:hypothetical protein